LAVSLVTIIDTLFDNVAGKLVFAELQNLATDFGYNHRLVSFTTTFQNVLNNIISILVLDKLCGAAMKLIKEGSLQKRRQN
jgi:hypothetical protein